MKGFIEVTDYEGSGLKVLIAVDKIMFVEEYADGTSFIVFKSVLLKKSLCKIENTNIGYRVSDSYSEVVKKIEEATK